MAGRIAARNFPLKWSSINRKVDETELEYQQQYLTTLKRPFGEQMRLCLVFGCCHMTWFDLQRKLCGKSVAMVGNAFSLLQKEYGAMIDSSDLVVRFNRGNFEPIAVSQGRRVDIAVLSPPAFFKPTTLPDDAIVLHVTPVGREQSPFTKIPDSINQKLRIELNHSRPSSGAMTINAFLSAKCSINLTLYGFDSKRSPTNYDIHRKHEPYDYSKEQKWVETLVREQKLTFVS